MDSSPNYGRGEAYVGRVFDRIASRYDLMNDVLSLGVHRLWKRWLVSNYIKPRPEHHHIDVAGGTGDVAFRIVDFLRRQGGLSSGRGGSLTVLDINQSMLDVGMKRAQKDGYARHVTDWVCGSGEALPFPDNTFDSYSVAFGIRNFADRMKGLQEAYRVLKPGGKVCILEFSTPCWWMKIPYKIYSKVFIPVAARLLAKDAESYRYLVDSISVFPDQQTFAGMIRSGGFDQVQFSNLCGGIACIHVGLKPK